MHDIAIVGGAVVDGTGASARRADILIDRGHISFVGMAKHETARETIDARGLTVTPGFIDSHAHGDALGPLSFDNFLLQGATTVLLGQDGTSPQDDDEHIPTLRQWRAAVRSGRDDARHPITLGGWMRAVAKRGCDVNVAALSGHGTARQIAGVGTRPAPDPAELAAMGEIVRADMAAGAFGISSGLEYVPGRYAATAELVALARVAGGAGGIVMSHLRSEDDDQIAGAIDELIAQGAYAPVEISHVKIVFGKRPAQAEAVLAQMASARARGIRIAADVYPYIAGFADMSLVYPPWAKSRADWDVAVRDRRAELAAYLFERVNKRNGPEAILIASGPYAGKTLKEVADMRHQPFPDVLIDVFGFGGPDAAHRVMNQSVQDVFITAPDVAISTDGAPGMRHPRSWGTYPIVFQNYVATGRLPLELAVYKMTGLPAKTIGLADRGIIAIGKAADLVVLDPNRVQSRATWTSPAMPPLGIRAVIVNGRIAAENGVRRNGRFGQVLRKPRR